MKRNFRYNADLFDKAPGLIVYETMAAPYVAFHLKMCENCERQTMRPIGSRSNLCIDCKKKITEERRRELERLAAQRQWH